MFHGIPHTPPPQVAAATAAGKCGASSSRDTHGARSRSQPAWANSGTQMTSSMSTSKVGLAPSRLIT